MHHLIRKQGPHIKRLIIAGLLAGASWPALAQSESEPAEKGMADQASEYVQDYLSDRRRVGALAGSILGGALTAHPAGTVVGSIVGFIIGKTTMFEDENTPASTTLAANRPIIPTDDQAQAAPTLSFANVQGGGGDGQPAMVAPNAASSMAPLALPAPGTAPSGLAPQGSAPATPYPAAPLPAGFTREQIASMCAAGRPADPRLRPMCFYFQGQ